jgi:hypothetical protein
MFDQADHSLRAMQQLFVRNPRLSCVGVQSLTDKATIGWDCIRLRPRVCTASLYKGKISIYIGFVKPGKWVSDQYLQIRI